MESKYLILIKRSDPLYPLAEKLAKHKGCKYVDCVASELIDGIGKFEGKREELEKICYELKDLEIKEIKAEILKGRKRGSIPFWIRMEIEKKEGIEEVLKKLKDYEEIYLLENEVFLRGKANSVDKICELEDKILLEDLKDYRNPEGRLVTYFVLKRF